MKMKSILLLAAMMGALAFTVHAQTTPPGLPSATPTDTPVAAAAGMPTFVSSLEGYATTINTNYSWDSNRLEIATGGDFIGGQNWANYIKGQYDFGRWDAEVNFRNLGIGGAIQSVEGGVGYALMQKFDTKLIGYIDGGYDFNRASGIFEPGAEIRKKGTLNTFFEAGISWPIWFSGPVNKYPDVKVGTGFTW